MPISVTYGPISAALQLARQSGAGESQWRRFSAEQQLLDRVQQQAAQALALRGQQTQEALAYAQLSAREREAAQELAQRQAQFGAETAYRRGTQEVEGRRVGIQEATQAQQSEARRRFEEQFGTTPEVFEGRLAERRVTTEEKGLGIRAGQAEATANQRAAEFLAGPIKASYDAAERYLGEMLDYANRVELELGKNLLIPPEEAQKARNAARDQIVMAKADRDKAYQKYLQFAQGQAGPLPQFGPPPAGAPSPADMAARIQSEAQMIAQQIQVPTTLRGNPAQVRKIVTAWLQQMGKDVSSEDAQKFIELVVSIITGGG